jgi:hypothetical protein
MGWLLSLFQSNNRLGSRQRQAMSSTHDAFTLPTSSEPHPDAFNPDTLQTPDPESASSRSFTYPPMSSGSYGYGPYVFLMIRAWYNVFTTLHLDLGRGHIRAPFFLFTIPHSIPRHPQPYPHTLRYTKHGIDSRLGSSANTLNSVIRLITAFCQKT